MSHEVDEVRADKREGPTVRTGVHASGIRHHVSRFMSHVTRHPSPVTRHTRPAAFTLMELLVVIAIIAVVTGIALPSIKAFKPQPLNAATTQFLNDLAYARRRAIADHTTVYVAFMPPTSALSNLNVNSSYLTPQLQQKLLKSQYIGYAMYEKRTVGDQPGASTPHWITDWRRLPDG